MTFKAPNNTAAVKGTIKLSKKEENRDSNPWLPRSDPSRRARANLSETEVLINPPKHHRDTNISSNAAKSDTSMDGSINKFSSIDTVGGHESSKKNAMKSRKSDKNSD